MHQRFGFIGLDDDETACEDGDDNRAIDPAAGWENGDHRGLPSPRLSQRGRPTPSGRTAQAHSPAEDRGPGTLSK